MEKSATLTVVMAVAAAVILSGCIIKDDRGLHTGRYKQVQKEKSK